LWLTGCNGPVNALSQAVRLGLVQGVRQGDADPTVQAIIVHCEGRTFFSGADLAELDQGLQPPGLMEFVTACEETPKVVIAALHGTVFGGGVVVAYACDHRIAAASTRFAMPEVGLGLLPTFGGTQYLPRLLGIEATLQLVIDGAEWSVDHAFEAGLVDQIVAGEDLLEAAALAATQGLPKRRVRDGRAHLRDTCAGTLAFQHRRQTLMKAAPDVEAPVVCLDVMQSGLRKPLSEALVQEHKAFLQLLKSTQSRRLRRLFFAERTLRRSTFDRAAVEGRLRAGGVSSEQVLANARALLREGAVPDADTLDALLVDVFGLARHAPSLIDELLGESD
jgi:3-hydroxyacyl-CoA dehydrogenase